MATVINLGKARKQQRRTAAVLKAAENRVRHGRTKEQKLRDEAEAKRATRALDQVRQEP